MITYTNDIIRMYSDGLNIRQIRNIFKVDYYTVRKILIDSGLFDKFKNSRNRLDQKSIIKSFNSGVSVYAIARKYSVDRNVIYRILRINGIKRRNSSEAQKLRYNKTNIKYRQNLTKNANEAIRNKPKEFHHIISLKQAIAKEKSLSKVGQFELDIIKYLERKGFDPIPQKALTVYNIDIAIGNIAIEIHVNSGNPHNMLYYRKRIINILKSGWDVIYIKITKRGLNKAGLNQLISLINLTSSYPSKIRKYWMIRGTGEIMTIGSFDGYNFAIEK